MGCCVYGGEGTNKYELEVLEDQTKSLQKINGNFGASVGDFETLTFKKDVLIKANKFYTLKLIMTGSQTKYGQDGKDFVIGPDGTNFVFSNSLLSKNSTSLSIGQIPLIQYFSVPDEGHPSLQVRFSIFSIYLLYFPICILDSKI